MEEHFDPNIPCSVWNHQSAGQRTAHTGLLDEAVGRHELLVEMEAIFTVLGCVALLRHLLVANYPAYVWGMFAILLAFAVAWIAFLIQRRR